MGNLIHNLIIVFLFIGGVGVFLFLMNKFLFIRLGDKQESKDNKNKIVLKDQGRKEAFLLDAKGEQEVQKNKKSYTIRPQSNNTVVQEDGNENQRLRNSSNRCLSSNMDDIDLFIRMTSLTVYGKGGVASITYDECAETKRGVYVFPIFIQDNNGIHVYGIMERTDGSGAELFVYLNDEQIMLEFPGHKQFVHATMYSYDSKRGEYSFVYSRIDCPAKRDSIIKPFMVVERNDYAKEIYSLYIIKNKRSIVKAERKNGREWGKVVFSEDANYLYYREYDNDARKVVYEKYNISKEDNAELDYRISLNQESDGALTEVGGKRHFYYAQDNSKASVITTEYAIRHCSVSVIPNEFEDDETKIIDIAVKKNDIESILFLESKCPNTGRKVYGLDPIIAIHVALDTYDFNDYLHRQISDNELIAYQEVFKLFQEKTSLNIEGTAQYIFDHYAPYNKRIITSGLFDRQTFDYSHKVTSPKTIYDRIYNELVESNRAPVKWKSEVDLYKLVKKYYSDAIYQYRNTSLLGMQSFDIFIPSLDTAIEYQGKQHYEAVSFFGGEEALQRNRERDMRKRMICHDNGIRLIEWRYDEPISILTLKKKMMQDV